ncbi:MAG: hypothetical protein H6843_10920 [Rhodospirillaceae bacterium]|nr:hypothetical protein [Rhodospirillaceae bacterium]
MRSMGSAGVAAAILVGSSAVAFGQTAAVPEDLRGVWATGACEAPGEVLIYTAGGAIYLSIDEDFVILSTYVKVDSFADGWFGFQEYEDTPDGTYDFFARVEGDTLHEGWPLNGSLTSPDELTPTDDRYVYGRCDALPPTYALAFGEGMAFTAAIGDLAPTCTLATMDFCVRGFFDLADVSGNGELSAAEFGRLLRMYAQHAALVEGMSVRDLLARQAGATVVGAVAGQALVLAFDYDASGQVSLDELLAGRDPAALPAAMLATLDWRQDQIDFLESSYALGGLLRGVEDLFDHAP